MQRLRPPPNLGLDSGSTHFLAMTLGQSLKLLKPQFPPLKVRGPNTDFTGWNRILSGAQRCTCRQVARLKDGSPFRCWEGNGNQNASLVLSCRPNSPKPCKGASPQDKQQLGKPARGFDASEGPSSDQLSHVRSIGRLKKNPSLQGSTTKYPPGTTVKGQSRRDAQGL